VLLFGGRGLGAEKEGKRYGYYSEKREREYSESHYQSTTPHAHATCTMERVRVTSSVGGRRRKCGKV
jgi:hypothetical protein